MRDRLTGKLLAWGVTLFMLPAIFITPSAAAQSPLRPASFNFCYQDIELYPNYTGDSATVPERDPGILVELVQLVAKEAGLQVNFLRYPWKRCLSLMKLGRIDGVIASFRPERQESVVYPMQGGVPDDSKMITLNSYYIYQKKANPIYWDGKAFVDPVILIGAPLGYSISAALKGEGLNVVETGTTEGLLHMLLYDRLQAVAAPGAAADTLLRLHTAEYASIMKVEAPLKVNHYFIVFSHQFFDRHQSAANRVWDASPMIHDANIDRLESKYALPGGTAAKP